MKILVVEDEPIPRMIMELALSDEGHSVRASGRAEEAIQMGIDFEPDIVISDLNLKDRLDGAEVCEAIRERHPKTRLIVISGCTPEEVRASSVRLFPQPTFMSKPCGIDEISDLVALVAA